MIKLHTEKYEDWLEESLLEDARKNFSRVESVWEGKQNAKDVGFNLFMPYLPDDLEDFVREALQERDPDKMLLAVRKLDDLLWEESLSNENEEKVDALLQDIEKSRNYLLKKDTKPSLEPFLEEARAIERKVKLRTQRYLSETAELLREEIEEIPHWNGSNLHLYPLFSQEDSPYSPEDDVLIKVGGENGPKIWLLNSLSDVQYSNSPQEDPALDAPFETQEDYFSLVKVLRDDFENKTAAPVQNEWYLNKYQPTSRDDTIVNFPTGLFLPGLVGVMDDKEEKPDKNVDYYANEIETILTHADLHRDEVDKAMSYLPNIRRVYDFLRDIGHGGIVLTIRMLLEN